MADKTWEREEGVTCVVCPDCAFTFDASHYDTDGGGDGYSCPACVENRVQRLADHWSPQHPVVGGGVTATVPWWGEAAFWLRKAMTGE